MEEERSSVQWPEIGPEVVDREVFERVWRRVMPDDTGSPIELGPAPRAEPQMAETTQRQAVCPPAMIAAPALAAAQPAMVGPVVEAVALGPAALVYTPLLEELMEGAQGGWHTYQALAQHGQGGAGRTLRALAADQRQALRRLSAAYFLITGRRYQLSRGGPMPRGGLAMSLRDQFIQEQRWAQNYQTAQQDCRDCELLQLYRDLSAQALDHALAIRLLLEQM